jgi:hypothetical protein
MYVVKELNHHWVYDVLSKLLFFGWKDMPTQMSLFRKNIISNQREWCCAFCFNEEEEEEIQHLFFNCSLSIRVWKKI